MKNTLSTLLYLLIVSCPLFASTDGQYISTVHSNGILTLNPGWQFVQSWQNILPCTGVSTCEQQQIIPTSTGTVWLFLVTTVSASGTDIPSSITSTGGGGSWTNCSACQIVGGGETITLWYNLTGTSGATAVRASFGQSETSIFTQFVEILPPTGYTATFDAGGSNVDATCTVTCTGTALSLTANDAIISFNAEVPGKLVDFFVYTGGSNYNWQGDVQGDGICMSCSVGTAPIINLVSGSGAGLVTSAIAFKSTAGNFKTAPPVFTMANINATWTSGQSTAYNCSPTCSYPIASTTAGNLLFIEASNEAASYISSISGGGTWVVPTQCQKTLVAANNLTLSCAYVLSASSGATSLSITMTGSASDNGFTVFEVHRNTGTWSLDAVDSTQNAPSFFPSGQGLTLTGNIDVLFNAFANDGAVGQCTFYPWYHLDAGGQYGNEFLWEQSTAFALLNSYNDAIPVCLDPQNNASIVNGAAFK